jgi:hypothetical protein
MKRAKGARGIADRDQNQNSEDGLHNPIILRFRLLEPPFGFLRLMAL